MGPNSKMRVLLASSSSGSHGGGEIFLRYLGDALVDAGHEVALWASDHPRMDELATKFSLSIRSDYRNTYDLRTRSLGAGFHFRNIKSATSDWKSWDPDIIHINKQNLEDGLDLLKAASDCGIPNLCTVHITQSARYLKASNAWLRDTVSRRALRNYPNLITAVSDRRQRELQEFAGLNGNVRRIYNGIPDVDPSLLPAWRAECRAELGITDSHRLITTVARMTAQKCPQAFFDAALEISQRQDDARFLWVGDGDFAPQWDRWVDEHDLSDRIQRLGWQDDTRPWFAASDVYLHLAKYEGLPLAILEAMRMSLPCFIAPSITEEVDIFADSPIQRAEGNWLDRLADADAFREPTRRMYEKHFRAGSMADQFFSLYRESI